MSSTHIQIAPAPHTFSSDSPATRETVSAVPALRHILLCSDFRVPNSPALAEAIRLCVSNHASLSVLQVRENISSQNLLSLGHKGATTCPNRGKACKNEVCLSSVLAEARAHGIDANVLLNCDGTGQGILKAIRSAYVDLVVLGWHEPENLERLIFGSIAETIFRGAACPVLSVGPLRPDATGSPSGPVVFATDFHPTAMHAAQYAAIHANAHHLPLHCLHVLPISAETGGKQPIIGTIITEALRQLTADGSICAVPPVMHVAYSQSVAATIVGYAREHNASLIVLGVRHGLHFESHLPMHLTNRILMNARCPVLTVSRTELSQVGPKREPRPAVKTN